MLLLGLHCVSSLRFYAVSIAPHFFFSLSRFYHVSCVMFQTFAVLFTHLLFSSFLVV